MHIYIYIYIYILILGSVCSFVPVPKSQCPNDKVANELNKKDCKMNMGNGELCQAHGPLPDGQTNYNINNCDNSNPIMDWKWDIFKCVKVEGF